MKPERAPDCGTSVGSGISTAFSPLEASFITPEPDPIVLEDQVAENLSLDIQLFVDATCHIKTSRTDENHEICIQDTRVQCFYTFQT